MVICSQIKLPQKLTAMLKELLIIENKQNFTNIPTHVGPSGNFIMFVAIVAAESGHPKIFSLKIKM